MEYFQGLKEGDRVIEVTNDAGSGKGPFGTVDLVILDKQPEGYKDQDYLIPFTGDSYHASPKVTFHTGVVPESSTAALGLLGAASFCFARKRLR